MIQTKMRVPLQAWYDDWLKEQRGTDLIYAQGKDGPQLSQVHYVRDTLAGLLWADKLHCEIPTEPPPRNTCRETAWVVGEHYSKSVRLPVYLMERPDLGIAFVLRDNYYNWKLSVICDRPLHHDLFPLLFHVHPPPDPDYTGNALSPVYFEGFPDDLIFGYHSEDPTQWSAEFWNQTKLYMTVFLCMSELGAIKPMRKLSREEHRAQLDRESALEKARWDAEKRGEKTWR